MTKPSIWSPGKRNGRKEPRIAKPTIWNRGARTAREHRGVGGESAVTTTAEAPPKRRRKRKYTVLLNDTWCKNCGICSAFCPTGTLEDAGHGEPRITDMDLCNGCQLCVVRCPDFAVAVEERSSDDGGQDASDAGQ
jgi:2-oxoglutarate ferredoxin oxidoreductase subunit delta